MQAKQQLWSNQESCTERPLSNLIGGPNRRVFFMGKGADERRDGREDHEYHQADDGKRESDKFHSGQNVCRMGFATVYTD